MNISKALASYPNIELLDKQVLLSHALNVPRSYLIAHSSDNLGESILANYKVFCKRRLAGEPIAYIIGAKDFFSRSYIVNPDTLIPRPETEELVELVLKLNPMPQSILDVGTGSGCIAITLAMELPNAAVTAVDISESALAIALQNSKKIGADVNFLQSDLLELIPNATNYDCIVANLPYLKLSDSLPSYEPVTALHSGLDGLDHYRRLFESIRDKQISFNHLYCEIGYDQKNAIIDLAERLLGKRGTVYSDLANIPRIFYLANNA